MYEPLVRIEFSLNYNTHLTIHLTKLNFGAINRNSSEKWDNQVCEGSFHSISIRDTKQLWWSYFKVLEEYVNNRHYPADWLFAEAFLLWEKKMRQNQMWMEKPLFIVI